MASGDQHILRQLYDSARWQLRSWEEIKMASLFTKANYINFFMFLAFVFLAIYQARSKMQKAEKAAADRRYLPAKDFPEIEHLLDFSWKDEEPHKLRTFKPKYHLTMALQKLDPSELILMDKNYLERLAYRKKIMKEHHDTAVIVNDRARIGPAVRELYTFLMGTYLPKRYPSMFKLHKASFETGDRFMLENYATKEVLPGEALKTSDPITLLEGLGRSMDEDFLFLLPETESEDVKEPRYILEASVTICPSGWDPREKLGKRLVDIHGPVPGYSSILQGSMDRYFDKVKVGEYVKRSNWNITTTSELFNLPGAGSNHVGKDDIVEELGELDVDNTFVRCERQTLHRLPKSKALVFGFKTYMYPIKDIKDEGLGEELAQAIDGMKEGNVPDMHRYKGGSAWGEAAKRYLRS